MYMLIVQICKPQRESQITHNYNTQEISTAHITIFYKYVCTVWSPLSYCGIFLSVNILSNVFNDYLML